MASSAFRDASPVESELEPVKGDTYMNSLRRTGRGLVRSCPPEAPGEDQATAPPCRRLLTFLFLGLAAVGCVGRTPVTAPSISLEPLPRIETLPYRLEAGDLLEVSLRANPELDQELRIRADGANALPFVDEVQAAELSSSELDAKLTRRYTGLLARLEITVVARDFAAVR